MTRLLWDLKMIRLKSGVEINSSEKPFIIAEIGSNWRNLDDCELAVNDAADANASAVKFQLFNHKALYGIDKVSGEGSYELPVSWLPRLKEIADKRSIEFMCSAFSPKLVEEVDKYVNIHKVASAEMLDFDILEACRYSGKPIILSTGGHTIEEIAKAVKFLKGSEIILMYCVASYPARQIFLERINQLKDMFQVPVGYSDHSLDNIMIPRLAIHHGAVVLEKHMTPLHNVTTPDSIVSLNYDQFKLMTKYLHKPNNDWPKYGELDGDEDYSMRTIHNRRLIATCHIRVGDSFVKGLNYGSYRSLDPVSNFAYDPTYASEIEGKTCRAYLEPGKGIWAAHAY